MKYIIAVVVIGVPGGRGMKYVIAVDFGRVLGDAE
jgi:hypothetical protein